ncbi:glutamate--cysteine ligase [Kitasatospora sp. GP82]|uniref:carboxylate-amine ligase n=1 Tax=Kitasatospora sp. GP82 TaxID=3035089 RepID=UPI002473FB62|nr:glutamate--cysteine ligase [Kitasatospora sp. GP82]MDH6125417.1 carboxylate-amine ligase [Kitasatospora sp. GP82]
MAVRLPVLGATTCAIQVPTMGVEEEFFLVDADSRTPVAHGPQVIADARRTLGPLVQAELYPTQIEVCSSPTLSGSDLRAELSFLRRTLASAAERAGCLLVASGTPVLPGAAPTKVTDTPRYRRMAERFGAVADGSGGGVCGCHVHLGTASRAQALALANRIRPWLPMVQALAVNSPFHAGKDSGFASWRAIQWNQWPTVGPSPVLDEAGYEQLADALVDSGMLLDRGMIYWYARPSEHVPTLEIRVADVSADLDTTIVIALLVRGLAAVLLAELEAGIPHTDLPTELLRAAHWRAAHDGLAGEGLDPVSGDRRPMRELVGRLLDRAEPGLAAAADAGTVRRLLDTVMARGTGATRQLHAYHRRGELRDVVDDLAQTTLS